MLVRCLLAMTAVTNAFGAAQEPTPCVDRRLARMRAERILAVRYELRFDLFERASRASGEAIVHFELPEDLPDQPVVLDFAGDDLADVRVNDVPRADAVRRVHDHLVVAPEDLVPGWNQISMRFTTPVAPTGTPLTVFRDVARDEEYLYTLVVPADAHRLYPCFDQPDLKGVFSVKVAVPKGWVAVANGAEKHPPEEEPDGRRLFWFEQTKPLSTYLVAFAAGPFEVLGPEPEAGQPAMRIFVRGSQLRDLDSGWLFAAHQRALSWLEPYFSSPYPFGKLDIVLAPAFPYGGMEHAGAIFYRESAIVFDHEPTESELLRRSTLVYHEVSHQWFGNLVTMAWFDDLWLKEGFATFVAFMVLDALEPERNAWLRFHQRIKPEAYRVDATAGTTPIYQELDNLQDAKSTYGAIVYNKAPAVLRELHERIGSTAFRDGVRVFLKDHAYANARWSDLVEAFEGASGKDLSEWSARWILAAGMPAPRVVWSADETGHVASFELVQRSATGTEATWPLSLELLWIEPAGGSRTFAIETTRARTALAGEIGREAPLAVLLNPRDVAYGQFLLDPESREYWVRAAAGVTDPLQRAIVLEALFEAVRQTELAPARFAELMIDLVGSESDPLTHGWLLDRLATTLRSYLHDGAREAWTRRAVEVLLERLRRGAPGLALQTFRFLVRVSAADEVLALCNELLGGGSPVPHLELGLEDRYLALAALLASDKAASWLPKMTGTSTPADAEKHAFVALAAARDSDVKAAYFRNYLLPDQVPEQWIQESLSYFHWPGQTALTLPYLRPALDSVEWVKEHRKIFFMPAWIDAFVNGHANADALRIVEGFLAEHRDLPRDISLKMLQSVDDLRRAVAIKDRWK